MATKKTKTKPQDSAPKERKLDLFREVLPAISQRNLGFYEGLSEEQKKEFSPWLVQRWCTGIENNPDWQAYSIQAVNERTNINMGALTKEHKELLWMLLASTGVRKTFRHVFPGSPKGAVKDQIRHFIEQIYPLAGEQEIDVLRAIHGEDELKEVAEKMNIKRSDIKDIFG